jgi:hypothetical protein
MKHTDQERLDWLETMAKDGQLTFDDGEVKDVVTWPIAADRGTALRDAIDRMMEAGLGPAPGGLNG